MFATRIAGLALAACLATGHTAFADGTREHYFTIQLFNGRVDSALPTQPDPLSDLPKASAQPKLAMPADPQPGRDINIGVGELQECTISKSMDRATPRRRAQSLKR